MTLKSKINAVADHASIIRDVIQGTSWKIKRSVLDYINPNKLNKLCCVEDWNNKEIKEVLSALGLQEFIHRKSWEWALGVVAMRKFGKLNEHNTSIGVGCGVERVLFYLANKLKHVYATDLYEGKEWKEAPKDFPENPKKYAPFPYKEDALTVLRMDGTKLEFPSDTFDVAFSFSSIEHFNRGGIKNHLGSLSSLREMERVLKVGGIMVVTTEYMINDKEHDEFFNKRTIYSDLIDKVQMRLVEPLDLLVTANTLDTVMSFTEAARWDNNDYTYKKTHPQILLNTDDILYTSLMLVFQKIT